MLGGAVGDGDTAERGASVELATLRTWARREIFARHLVTSEVRRG